MTTFHKEMTLRDLKTALDESALKQLSKLRDIIDNKIKVMESKKND